MVRILAFGIAWVHGLMDGRGLCPVRRLSRLRKSYSLYIESTSYLRLATLIRCAYSHEAVQQIEFMRFDGSQSFNLVLSWRAEDKQ